MAVRAYYPCNLEEMILQENRKDDGDDFDGMSGFLKSFQLAIVLFVLPTESPIFQRQLNDSSSHFHRSQRLVSDHIMSDTVWFLDVVCLTMNST
jgi:hypothetical protein